MLVSQQRNKNNGLTIATKLHMKCARSAAGSGVTQKMEPKERSVVLKIMNWSAAKRKSLNNWNLKPNVWMQWKNARNADGQNAFRKRESQRAIVAPQGTTLPAAPSHPRYVVNIDVDCAFLQFNFVQKKIPLAWQKELDCMKVRSMCPCGYGACVPEPGALATPCCTEHFALKCCVQVWHRIALLLAHPVQLGRACFIMRQVQDLGLISGQL
ncbi:hypothetical protein niasHT_012060 [Heterodera trifolii]|uniref:Uncharacterized protein n=1 Tax=Heterodera trifolii TaxID=157864 RepID=A0ABD2LAL5_9BILA